MGKTTSPHCTFLIALLGLAMLGLVGSGLARADVVFRCPAQTTAAALDKELDVYLLSLGIEAHLVSRTTPRPRVLRLTLTTPQEDTNTLDLASRPELAIKQEHVLLPHGTTSTTSTTGATDTKAAQREVATVSRKEIMLALLQHGRTTEFSGKTCSVTALKDQIGIRQNTVAWAETLNWLWPDGEEAQWNTKFWDHGTPKRGVSLQAAIQDTFEQQNLYSIGCYTATKLVVIQGMLDYYQRIKPDPLRVKQLKKILLADGEPLVNIEPGRTWRFEADFDRKKIKQAGKLLTIATPVAANNFVPGDWALLINTDAHSYQKTGYEGSNAIYLGNNRFDDYFNDNNHSYTFEEKINEVFQWRNGVFSLQRDSAKIQPLTHDALLKLTRTPAEGGLLLNFRLVPRNF